MNRVIDFHRHVTPPEYLRLMERQGISESIGFTLPKFNPKKDRFFMRKTGIDYAYLSISTPGVFVNDAATSSTIARAANNYIRTMVDTYPDSYGGFGALPFPAIEESLEELEYIFDVLGLQGVGLLSNVDGIYVGDPGFDELFQELDRRKAVVFIHPDDLLEAEGRAIALTPYFERYLDTTRCGYNLLLNGYLKKYPNISFVLSHGGGALPVMADRIARAAAGNGNPDPSMALLQNMFFDTAQRGHEILNGLNAFCGPEHIVFGSDSPYVPPFEVRMCHKDIGDSPVFSDDQRTNLYSGAELTRRINTRSK